MYVLELIRTDKAPAKTKDRMLEVEDTYHASILHTIASALAELNAKNNIDLHVHTRLLWSSISMNLERILPQGQQVHGHQEKHSYYQWMMEQMKKR